MEIISKESNWVRGDIIWSKTEGATPFFESLMPIYEPTRYRTDFTAQLFEAPKNNRRRLNFSTWHQFLGVEPRARQSVDLMSTKFKLLGRWTIYTRYDYPFKNCFI